jgi:hypothetical protein
MKLVREYINEKFTEDSDPIHDMGIGLRHKIEEWIKSINKTCRSQSIYTIEKYRINVDLTITVYSNCCLPDGYGNLPEFVKFKTIVGDFFVCNSALTTLRGCPQEVTGEFNCESNKLRSLKYAPKIVGGRFMCSDNDKQFTEEDVKAVCNVRGIIKV